VGEALLRELAFEPLMAVQTDLHRVGKVGTELDEQRTEVPVEHVDVVVIDGNWALFLTTCSTV